MDTLLQDLRYGARRLARSPGFTAVAAIVLALGIGANTAIFSAINALLLRPLPYPEPERLVTVWHRYPDLDLDAPVSALNFRRYRDETRSFESVAVASGWAVNLSGSGEPERVSGGLVSARYFDVFGVRPALGRAFLDEEDVPGRERVVVVSHGFWQRALGGTPDAIGRRLTLNGESHEVIGVMPPGYRDFWDRDVEVWRPVAFTPEQLAEGETNEWLALAARLKPGVSRQEAAAEMRTFAGRLKEENPLAYPATWTLDVESLDEVRKGELRPALLVLLAAVGFVLLIACANVANLMLARAMDRADEMVIRSAIGAGRRHLLQQLLAESALLGLLGGLLGLVLAGWGVAALSAALGDRLPAGTDLSPDLRVLGFTLLLSLLTGLLFGAIPAAQASRLDLQRGLREGGRGLAGDRAGRLTRRALVVGEVALALILLTGAGLLVKSFARLQDVDPGFRTDRLLTFSLSLPETVYDTDERRVAVFREVLERLEAAPGIEAAGVTQVLPFSGSWSTGTLRVEGYEPPADEMDPWGDIRMVSAGYRDALGMPLLRGRFLDEREVLHAPGAVVVDEEFARRYWPGEDPVGRRVTFDEPETTPADSVEWLPVVGVVGHTKHAGLDDEDRIQVYVPYEQVPGVSQLSFAVRTEGDPLAAAGTVRRVVQGVDPQLPLARVRTMDEMVGESLGPRRVAMLLLALFSGLAATLAAVGIYGVISHLVALRTRELGVRMALGAGAGRLLRLVLRQGLELAVLGVVLGLVGGLAAMRLVSSQLYGVGASDPATFVTTSALLVLVAAAAALLPALRAARLDPAAALRTD
ncbi:MAG TPA: ABC transporter permease [Gemmatimonadota bacterium]